MPNLRYSYMGKEIRSYIVYLIVFNHQSEGSVFFFITFIYITRISPPLLSKRFNEKMESPSPSYIYIYISLLKKPFINKRKK